MPFQLDEYLPIGNTIIIVLWVVGSIKWFQTTADAEKSRAEVRSELEAYKTKIAEEYIKKNDVETKITQVYNKLSEMKTDIKEDMKDLKTDMQQMISAMHDLINQGIANRGKQ